MTDIATVSQVRIQQEPTATSINETNFIATHSDTSEGKELSDEMLQGYYLELLTAILAARCSSSPDPAQVQELKRLTQVWERLSVSLTAAMQRLEAQTTTSQQNTTTNFLETCHKWINGQSPTR